MRQRNKPWADDFIKKHHQLIISDPITYKSKWQALFKNNNPIHIEIGTGKGQFIVGMAEMYPHINFIGIELSKSVIVTAAQKVLESKQENILLLNVNAEQLLDYFSENEIATIYLNFSDPWPKNRHEKRRLTYKNFLRFYEKIIQKNGKVILKTDNRKLFEYSLVSFSQFPMKIEEVNLDLHAEEDIANVQTEYEEKFAAKGQNIYRCIASFK
ncbi:tRNA (guanosine(46)-N7)-methyltransferase TrmB [Virgibacillus soli]|uniref:tRNA (guanine-N(7)-)-methyltransferase n=1 Tax=Paracerasibacillus soli TaxID=480284 RepID=A0ABU5CTH8_9BACI|nr:tRNA (guanosine(46)-N7)-methyltransferase TrmB [Virgibacillus soli]MDY0408730.1 tRNA (guanosine(46)-N7)-methyltransferase TrmB [Virgibacillus soli]